MTDTNQPGLKSTELWLASITGIISTILSATAPSDVTVPLIVCLAVVATVYIVCRTAFKIARLKYRPDLVTSFKVPPESESL